MNKLLTGIILVLVLYVAFSKNGCTPKHQKSDTLIVHDTTWQRYDSLVYSKPKPGKIVYMPPTVEYLADTNYARLKEQYDSLLKEFFALKTYYDTVRLDTLGYVSVIDSVQKNGIIGRSFHTNYKIPTITTTKTITHYAPPKAALFFGGGVEGNKTLGVTGANVGILYKSKKDKIVGLNVGSTIGQQLTFGVSSYWKIK